MKRVLNINYLDGDLNAATRASVKMVVDVTSKLVNATVTLASRVITVRMNAMKGHLGSIVCLVTVIGATVMAVIGRQGNVDAGTDGN